MTVVGRGYLEIGADTSKVDGEISKGMDSVGSKAGGIFSNAFSTALGIGIAKVVPKITGALSSSFRAGFARLSAIDEATSKLEGLGHSAEAVEAIMDNALASVKGTAFGLGEAATVAASTVAAGIKPGQELERTLKLVADASSIAGTSMGDMGSIFNKVATSNKIQAREIHQLHDRAIPIIQLLAEELGVAQEEVSALASKGQIDFATFQNAIERGMGGAALSSGETFVGALANVRTAMGRLGAEFLGPSFQQMAPFFQRLIGFIDDMAPAFARAGEGLGKLTRVFTSILPVLQFFKRDISSFELAEALDVDPSISNGFIGVVLRMRNAFTGLKLLIRDGNFTSILQNALGWEEDTPIVGALMRVHEVFAKVRGTVSTASSAIQNAIQPLKDKWAEFTGALNADVQLGAVAGVGAVVAGALLPLLPMLGAALPLILRLTTGIPGLGAAVRGLTGVFRGLGGVLLRHPLLLIAGVLLGVATAFSAAEGASGPFADMINGLGDMLSQFLADLPGLLETYIPVVVDGIVNLVSAMADGISTHVPKIVDALATGLVALVGAIATIIPVLVDGVVDLVMAIVGTLPTLIPTLLAAAQTLFMALVDSLSTILPVLLDGVLMVVQTIVDNLPTLIPMLLEAAVLLFTAFVDSLTTILPVLIEGIVSIITQVVEMLPTLIPILLEAAVLLFTALIDALPVILPTLIEGVVQVIMAVVEHLPTLIGTLLGAAVTLFTSIVTAVWNILPNLLGAIGSLISDAIGAVTGAVGRMLDAGRQFLTGLWDGVKNVGRNVTNWFKDLPGNLLGALGSVGTFLLDAGSKLLGGLWDGAKNMFKGVGDWFGNLGGNIKNTVGNLGNTLVNAGKSIINGFSNAAKSAWEGTKNFFGGIGSWIQQHKGPEDYDKKLLVPAGRWIMQGLQHGLESQIPNLQRTLAGITGKLQSGMNVHTSVLPRNTLTPVPAPASVAGPSYVFERGAVTLDVSDLRQLSDLEDFVEMLRVRRRKAG